MKKLIFCVIIIASGIIQATFLSYFRVFTVKVDLLLICAVIAALSFPLKWSLFFCLLAGVFKDAFGVNVFGLNTALFCLWGFLIAKLMREITIDNNMMRILLIAVVTLFHNLLTGMILIYFGEVVPFGVILRVLILSPILTSIFFIPVFKLVRKSCLDPL